VRGCLGGQAAKVEVKYDLQGARVSEQDAKVGIRDNTTVASSCGPNVDAASKYLKLRKVWVRGTTHFVQTRRLIAVWDKILETGVVIKCK
jgi:hypothetical protein